MTPMLPGDACDCHVHLFGPAQRYPFDSARVYTPGDADETTLDALHRRLGIERVVLVQPSVYGTDNRRLLDGLAALGSSACAVAVIDDATTDADLTRMHAAGVRGVRVNLSTSGIDDPAEAWRRIDAHAASPPPLGWHVQVLMKAPAIAALADRLARLPCPLVIDHFGQPDLAQGPEQPAFRAILDLLRAGRAVVKLSAMERLAGKGGLGRLAPFAKALAQANPNAVVWGSDWPHTGGGRGLGPAAMRPAAEIEPFAAMDDADALQALLAAMPDPTLRRAVLVDNPARIYGFSHEVPS
jgi:predicted TIM-barrel fold metal-dependent hydrolase